MKTPYTCQKVSIMGNKRNTNITSCHVLHQNLEHKIKQVRNEIWYQYKNKEEETGKRKQDFEKKENIHKFPLTKKV